MAAPTGPRGDAAPATNGTPAAAHTNARIGPHPGYISSSNQYSSEVKVRRMLKDNGCDPAREDTCRLQGVQLIDNVREHLRLPARTFDTAATYYHKFRLNFRDSEYNYQDAALASLFVACKVEDTIKKSREILAAAYNVKNPEKPMPADDKAFESQSRTITGLERLILETVGFDFRTRYPQKLLAKVVRSILGRQSGRDFYKLAYAMCTDMYKTFVPIKKTTFTMVMAVVELTARLQGDEHLEKVKAFAARKKEYARASVVETMLDILDLYVQHQKVTKVGALFEQSKFIDIKIQLNADLESSADPRHMFHCNRCDNDDSTHAQPATPASSGTGTSATSMSTILSWPGDASVRRLARGENGTMRFVFDPEAAKKEHDTVTAYWMEEFEEYEVETEEPIPPPPHYEDARGRGYHGGHRDRGDYRRGGHHGGYRGDRRYGGGGGRGRYH